MRSGSPPGGAGYSGSNTLRQNIGRREISAILLAVAHFCSTWCSCYRHTLGLKGALPLPQAQVHPLIPARRLPLAHHLTPARLRDPILLRHRLPYLTLVGHEMVRSRSCLAAAVLRSSPGSKEGLATQRKAQPLRPYLALHQTRFPLETPTPLGPGL
jgi:hypothetical protein